MPVPYAELTARYWLTAENDAGLNGWIDYAQLGTGRVQLRYLRLPELYCGFARDLRYYNIPAEYPVSCSPQAWAAGTMIHFFQALLGIEPDAANNRVRISPLLPPGLDRVDLTNLRVGRHTVDLIVLRHDDDGNAQTMVVNNPGDLQIDAD